MGGLWSGLRSQMVLGKGLASSLVESNSGGHIVDMLHVACGSSSELVGRGHSFLPLSLSVLQTCLHLVVFVVPSIIGLRSYSISIMQLTPFPLTIFFVLILPFFTFSYFFYSVVEI